VVCEDSEGALVAADALLSFVAGISAMLFFLLLRLSFVLVDALLAVAFVSAAEFSASAFFDFFDFFFFFDFVVVLWLCVCVSCA